MLTHLHINNFVIVKSLTLDFQQGLHVLTGETGAGKSIWIDAIEIGLGGRADAQVIFPGAKTADITLCFDLNKLDNAKAWLASHDFPVEEECIIRRVIDLEKPSRTTLNGIPIPQQLVRSFAEQLVCIHGQHQHQQLLKADKQRDLLDHYAESNELLCKIAEHVNHYKALDVESQKLQQQAKNKSSDLTLWQYQLDELEKLAITENEYDTLFSRYQQLHQLKKNAVSLHDALARLTGDDHLSPSDIVRQTQQKLAVLNNTDAAMHAIQELLQTAIIHLDEATDALQQHCSTCDFSAEKLEKIEKRLTVLQDIARKHHVDPSELSHVIRSLQNNIAALEQSDERLSALEKQKQSIMNAYLKDAAELTTRRQKASKKLSAAITEHMQTLGMNGGSFSIQLERQTTPIHITGNESVHFLISTNPGQPLHALSQTVSGGELSRLSLMLQVLTAQKKNTPTLIFDEVDVGIGGKTADLVGKLLRQLAARSQVLCVTHLPQVAACGHHHFKAEKQLKKENTATTIAVLSKEDRTQEIARMLSGAQITEKSMLHATELLSLHEQE